MRRKSSCSQCAATLVFNLNILSRVCYCVALQPPPVATLIFPLQPCIGSMRSDFFLIFGGLLKSSHCFYNKILKFFFFFVKICICFLYILTIFKNYMNMMLCLSKHAEHKMVIHAKIDSGGVRVVLSRWTYSEPETIFTGTALNTPKCNQNSVGHITGHVSMSLLGSGLYILLMLVLLLSHLFAPRRVPWCHFLCRFTTEGQCSSGQGEAWGTELSKACLVGLSLPRGRIEYIHN